MRVLNTLLKMTCIFTFFIVGCEKQSDIKTESQTAPQTVVQPTLSEQPEKKIDWADEHRKKLHKEVVELINKGEYEIASGKAALEMDKFEDIKILYNYVKIIEENQQKKNIDKQMIMYLLSQIPSDYNGDFSDEINAEKSKYVDDPFFKHVTSADLKIGMTSEEALNSKWGKPNSINKTTTANGTTEQWVYNGGKYVYLENGVVTAFQE